MIDDSQQKAASNEPMQQDASNVFVARVFGWAIVAFGVSFLLATNPEAPGVIRAGFWGKFFAIALGTVTGTIGALIGNFIREIIQPDGFMTSGGFFQILWIKFFWRLSPQLIALFLGSMLGAGWVLS